MKPIYTISQIGREKNCKTGNRREMFDYEIFSSVRQGSNFSQYDNLMRQFFFSNLTHLACSWLLLISRQSDIKSNGILLRLLS